MNSPVVIIMASDICSKKAFKCSAIFSRSMISQRKKLGKPCGYRNTTRKSYYLAFHIKQL